jgi:hypothetical protein
MSTFIPKLLEFDREVSGAGLPVIVDGRIAAMHIYPVSISSKSTVQRNRSLGAFKHLTVSPLVIKNKVILQEVIIL